MTKSVNNLKKLLKAADSARFVPAAGSPAEESLDVLTVKLQLAETAYMLSRERYEHALAKQLLSEHEGAHYQSVIKQLQEKIAKLKEKPNA